MSRKLSVDDRGRIAEKVMEWGNLIFISVVVVQFFPGPLNKIAIAASTMLLVFAYLFAIFLMKGGNLR